MRVDTRAVLYGKRASAALDSPLNPAGRGMVAPIRAPRSGSDTVASR
jgi:hypothetical protein